MKISIYKINATKYRDCKRRIEGWGAIGTVTVISVDPPCKKGSALFTTIHFIHKCICCVHSCVGDLNITRIL